MSQDAASVPGPPEAAACTPVQAKGPVPPSTAEKKRRPAVDAKRKREEEAERQRIEAEKKARTLQASENLEAAILAAAPSAAKVLEILQREKATATLANAVNKIAMSANARASENKARVATLWPSIEKQLQAQMAFSKNLKGGRCQKQLKLEVPIVPAEAPRQWMSEYDAKNQIMVNAKGKKLMTDSPAQLRFTADVSLGKSIGWGYTSGMLSVSDGLTFTYCKVSRTLVITGKYGLGY